MGSGARLTKSDDRLRSQMSNEEICESIRQIRTGVKTLVRFDHRANPASVDMFNSMILDGCVKVSDEARIRLHRVAQYKGPLNCFGSWASRVVELTPTESFDPTRLEALVPVLSHVQPA